MSLQYDLSYKSGKHSVSTLHYDANDASIKISIAKENNHSFMCFSDTSFSTMSILSHINFSNDNQKLRFEQALKNRELRKVLEIAKKVEPLINNQMNLFSNPVCIFVTECLKEQQKTKEYNGRFFVAHGPFKKKQDPTHLSVMEAPALIR